MRSEMMRLVFWWEASFFLEKWLWWCSPGHTLLLSWSEVRQVMVNWGFQSDHGLLAALLGTPGQSAAAATVKSRWPPPTVTPPTPVVPLPPASCSPGSSSPTAPTPNHYLPFAVREQPALPSHPCSGKIWQNWAFLKLLRSPGPTFSCA